MSYRFSQDASRSEAAGALTRFAESDARILEPDPINLFALDVGTYDKTILTNELLSAPRFPDYPEDPYLVKENELKNLDQLLAWCVKYGVHLQIAMSRYMDTGGPNMEWANYAASLGIALACHPYFPAGTCGGDYPESPFMASHLYWPRPFFKRVLISEDELTISGEGLSGILSPHLRSCDQDTTLEFYADGTLFDSRFLPEGKQPNEYVAMTGTTRPSRWTFRRKPGQSPPVCLKTGWLSMAAGIENQSFHTYLMCHDAYESDAFASSHLSVAAYHQDFLEMLTHHGIGWCYCELYNGFPKHLVILYGEESQWNGAATENITVTYGDGQTDVFRQYTESL